MSLVFNGNTINDVNFNSNAVEHVVYNGATVWEKAATYNASEWMNFKIHENGTVSWNLIEGATTNKTIYYQKNSTSTSGWISLTSGNSFSVSAGDRVYFKGDYAAESGADSCCFSSTCKFSVCGNIQSLHYAGTSTSSSSFSSTKTTVAHQCHNLFLNCTTLVSAYELYIPNTSFAAQGFMSMFEGCTNLEYPPYFEQGYGITTIPVQTQCFQRMFRDCSKLKYSPKLLVNTVNLRGFYYMFYNCTSMTNAYIAISGNVGESGCDAMFYKCSNLTSYGNGLFNSTNSFTVGDYGLRNMFRGTKITQAPNLNVSSVGEAAMYCMFMDCSNLVTGPSILPATTLAKDCYRTMFSNCVNMTSGPELPALELVDHCYHYMFNNCQKINRIVCYATTNLINDNLSNFSYGVASTGVFVKSSGADWSNVTYGIPSGWTTKTGGVASGILASGTFTTPTGANAFTITNPNNIKTDTSSTTYASLKLAASSSSTLTSEVYIEINKTAINSIPANASIYGLTCKFKFKPSSTTYVTTDNFLISLCAGTTLKGTQSTSRGSAISTRTLDGLANNSSWTRNELDDIRLYLKATHNKTTSAGYIYAYGLELEIKYEY